jgi:hypothetical protein
MPPPPLQRRVSLAGARIGAALGRRQPSPPRQTPEICLLPGQRWRRSPRRHTARRAARSCARETRAHAAVGPTGQLRCHSGGTGARGGLLPALRVVALAPAPLVPARDAPQRGGASRVELLNSAQRPPLRRCPRLRLTLHLLLENAQLAPHTQDVPVQQRGAGRTAQAHL